jgi:hypothetical protein
MSLRMNYTLKLDNYAGEITRNSRQPKISVWQNNVFS